MTGKSVFLMHYRRRRFYRYILASLHAVYHSSLAIKTVDFF